MLLAFRWLTEYRLEPVAVLFYIWDKTLTLQEVKVVGKNETNFICC